MPAWSHETDDRGRYDEQILDEDGEFWERERERARGELMPLPSFWAVRCEGVSMVFYIQFLTQWEGEKGKRLH